jgi:predicted TIM-barrel fold metal-dependent hydrolase
VTRTSTVSRRAFLNATGGAITPLSAVLLADETPAMLPDAIRFCHGRLGPERLLFAGDHPWVEPRVILDALAAAKLPAADVEGISSANARRLFAL